MDETRTAEKARRIEESARKKRGVAVALISLLIVGAFLGYVMYLNNESKKVEILDSGFKSNHKKDTYSWACVVKNNGDKPLDHLIIEISAYDKDGNVLKTKDHNSQIKEIYNTIYKIPPGATTALTYERTKEDLERGFESAPYDMKFKIAFTGLKWVNKEFPYKLKITDTTYVGDNWFNVTVKNKGKTDFDSENWEFGIAAVYKDKKGRITGGTSEYYHGDHIPAGKKITVPIKVKKGDFENYEFYLRYEAWGDDFHL